MAVLCEALSVVIRTGSVKEKFDGGFSGFLDKIPNKTYCSDGELERIGFLSPTEIGEFIAVLETSGLTFQAIMSPSISALWIC